MAIKNKQGRKWLITINNPQEKGLEAEDIPKKLDGRTIQYYCFCEEISSTGTPHIHIFICTKSPMRFTTLQRIFPGAHIDPALGSCLENRAYLLKEGKWEETEKAETKVEGSFREFGQMPTERIKKPSTNEEIVERIKDGASVLEIIEEFPEKAMQVKNIKAIRAEYVAEKNNSEKRNVKTTLVTAPKSFDAIGLVFQKHRFSDVCRITNYGKAKGISFDTYVAQNTIVFDNFDEQIPLEDLVIYLGDYPVTLPARYEDRTAAYETVYIITEKDLSQLYRSVSIRNSGLVKRFISLIDEAIIVDKDGEITEVKLGRE